MILGLINQLTGLNIGTKNVVALTMSIQNLDIAQAVASLSARKVGDAEAYAALMSKYKNAETVKAAMANYTYAASNDAVAASQGKVTTSELTGLLVTKERNAYDAYRLALNAGLIASEDMLEDEIQEVTRAMIMQAITSGQLSLQEGLQLAANLGLATSFDRLALSIVNATKSMWTFLTTNPIGWAILTIGAIVSVIAILEKVTVTVEEQREKLEELKSAHSEIKSELESLNSELKTTAERMAELEGKGNLTFTEKEEYDNLVKTNNELQRKIQLLELEEKLKNKEVQDAFVTTMDKDVGDSVEHEVSFVNEDIEGYAIGDKYLTDELGYIQYQFDKRAQLSEELENVEAKRIKALSEAETERQKKIIEEKARKEKESLQKQIDSIDTFLTEKNSQWTTDSDGVSYIEDPKTEDEKKLNQYLDMIADFQDQLSIEMGLDGAKTTAFNRLVDNWQFDDIVQGLQDLGEEGKVTAEMLDDPKYDEFIDKLVELGIIDSADNLDLIADAFNGVTEEASNASEEIYNVVSALEKINENKTSLNSIFDQFEENGYLSLDEVTSMLAENPEYIYYLTEVEGQYKLNQQALEDWNSVVEEQQDIVDNMMGDNAYLESYDEVLNNIMNGSSHGENDGVGNTRLTEEALDSLITKNKELNDALLNNKITTVDYFNSISDSITNSGLASALQSLNGEFDESTDYIEQTVSVLSTELSDAMLQSNKRFLKGETSVEDYIDELIAGSKAQQKLLKSTYDLTVGRNGYAEAMYDADEATQNAIDGYNDLVDAQKELDSVDGFVNTLSDNAEFLSSYTDSAGNLMDGIFDDSRFSTYVNSLSQDLVNFANTSQENMDSVVQALVDTAGIGEAEATSLIAQGANAISSTVGGSLSALQGMTSYAMGSVGDSITNTSSAIGSVLSSLGKMISGFNYNISATPYVSGRFKIEKDENGIPSGISLPTFGFKIKGNGGSSVSDFANSLSSAGTYFTNAGSSQAKAKALNIDSYLPSGTGKGSTVSGKRDTSGDGGGSSETAETFNWIEVAISRVQRTIANLGKTVSATYKSWSERNGALASEISEVNKEISLQEQSYDYYMNKADSVGLSDYYKGLVQSGAIKIEDITDESLVEKIQQYQEFYEAALDAKDATQDLEAELASLAMQKFDNISKEFEDKMSLIEHQIDMLDGQISQTEAKGYIVSTKYYENLINLEQQNIDILKKERAAMQQALKDSGIEPYTEDWYSMMASINDVDKAIQDANTSVIEYRNNIRELKWEVFDKTQEMLSELQEEGGFLIDLMSDDKLVDEKGSFTDQGRATLGLHTVNFNAYMAQAEDYAKEIQEIDKELANDPYNQTLLERRKELLEAQRDNISAAKDEKQAIKDLYSDAYDALLDYMSELIDKRKELLQATKDLYDYEKNIAEMTKEIASLEKQLAAYAGDDSEESRATIQQIKVSLEEAKENLEETEYEKYLSDQEQMLDTLYDQTEEWVNARLDNLELLIGEAIEATNANAVTIKETLETETSEVGTTLSEKMDAIWSTGGSASSVVAAYGDDFSTKLTTTNNVLSEIRNFVASMVEKSDKEASSNVGTTSSPSGSGSSGSTSGSSTGTSTGSSGSPTTNKTNNNSSSSTSSKSDGSFFVYKKDSYPKSKLRIDTSIVDRLKYRDYNSSFSHRRNYYAAMGLGSASSYTGSASQNKAMINWMKQNRFAKGGTIGSLVKSAGEDGFVLARTGEEILSLEKIRALGDAFAYMNPIVDNLKSLCKVYIPPTTASNSNAITVEIGDIQMYGINDPEAFAVQLRHALKYDNLSKKIIQDDTLGVMTGKASVSKYRY